MFLEYSDTQIVIVLACNAAAVLFLGYAWGHCNGMKYWEEMTKWRDPMLDDFSSMNMKLTRLVKQLRKKNKSLRRRIYRGF